MKDFLSQLKTEAQYQAALADDYILPRSWGKISAFVFEHSLIFILVTSFLLAFTSTIFFAF